MKRIIILLFISCGFVFNSNATHLMGGEITWKCIKSGPDLGKYIFQVKIYRDCQGVALANVNNKSLVVHNNVTISSIPLTYMGSTDISPYCNDIDGPNSPFSCNGANSAYTGNGAGAVEEHVFESAPTRIAGQPDADGWHFTYSDVARNITITNLANVASNEIGFTLRAVMYSYLDSLNNVFPQNDDCYDSSPKFYEKPRTILEVNNGYDPLAFSNGFTYSHNAFDDERDSLYYDFAQPIDGYDGFGAPPYDYLNADVTNAIPFVPPFSVNSPINGIQINNNTGKTYYPASLGGNFVTCTKVSAFKCGQVVSEIYREVQVVLVPPTCNLGDTTGGNIGADTLCNVRPLVQPPFFFPLGQPQYQWDTIVHCGDTVSFDFIANDYDVNPNGTMQNLQFTVSGGQFMDYNTIPANLCDNPPCATFEEIGTGLPPPFTSSGGTGAGHFEWITSCNHTISTCGNDLLPSLYTFVIKVQDDFCPAPAIENTAQVISILVCPPCDLMKANATSTPATCAANDGTISVNPAAGIPPYQAFYFDMNGIPVNPDSLIAGDYEVRVRDSSLCETIDTITVGQTGSNIEIDTSLTIINDTICFNTLDGSIDITPIGGDLPYTFLWSNGETTEDLDVLSSGVYSVVIWDSLLCSSVPISFDIFSYPESISSIDTASCDSYDWNGVNYTVSGIYDAIFTNSVGCDSTAILDLTIYSSDSSFSTLTTCDSYNWNGLVLSASGAYDTTLINSVGCDSVVTLDLTINSSDSVVIATSSCDSYEWNGVSYTISGIYDAILVNSTGCDSIVILDLTINSSNNFSSTASSVSVSCFGSSDGSASVTPISGTAPFSYLWNNGASTQSVSALSAGEYTVMIMDSNSCVTYDTVTVYQPSEISSSLTVGSGTLTGIASGGSVPYSYTFYDPSDAFLASSANNFGTSFTINPLVSGEYTMITTDLNGCTDTVTALFATNFSPDVSISISNNSCDSLTDLSITVSQDSGEVDMSTALLQSNAGSFDIASMSVGDTIGTSTLMAGGGSINLSSFLIVQNIPSASTAIIESIDTVVGNLGTFTISNQPAGGVNIISTTIFDGNNFTSGNMSSVLFDNVFINPCVPLVFTTEINSELGDLQITTFTFAITELNNIIFDDLRIYPNPVKDRLTIDFNRTVSKLSISIYDILGKDIYYHNQFYQLSSKDIIITHLESGIYFLTMDVDGVRYNHKLIIQD